MANDLRRSFELLEILLPAFFSGAKSIFKEELRFNTNSHLPIKNATMKALLNIPANQGELDFYSFTQKKFEQLFHLTKAEAKVDDFFEEHKSVNRQISTLFTCGLLSEHA